MSEHYKLLTEYRDDDENAIVESVQKDKDLYIRGIFMQSDKVNGNGRVYPRSVMERAVNAYKKSYMVEGRMRSIGELNHPPTPKVNPERASHLITKLEFDGNNVIGEARILRETPMGSIVAGLIKGGASMGVSSRGLGSVNERSGQKTVDSFHLSTVDVVYEPSAPDAFVEGIMEGCEWIFEEGCFKPVQKEVFEDIRKQGKIFTNEEKIEIFRDALKNIKNEH